MSISLYDGVDLIRGYLLKMFIRLGWKPSITFLQYGKHFMKHRTIFQQWFSRQESLNYQAIQVHEGEVLLGGILKTPDRLEEHLGRYVL